MIKRLPWVIAFLLSLTSLSGYAQQTPASAQQLTPLDEDEAPAITIRKPDEAERKITEKRQQGKVQEVKVQRGKNTYYLKPNNPAGSAVPGDTQSNATRPPQWVIQEFDPDAARTKQAREAAAARTAPPPPAGADQ